MLGLAPVTFTTSSSLPAGTHACIDIPPPVSSSTPSYRSSVPLKFDADVIADRPGMFTWPGDSRYGIVSLRFSCAVNPFAAHAATPSEPLPSGIDWLAGGVRRAEHDVGFGDHAGRVQRERTVLPGSGDRRRDGGLDQNGHGEGTAIASPAATARRRDSLYR